MNSFFVCLMVALLCSSVVFAQKTFTSKDSVIDQTDFKHNKQYFLDHYAYDDSTKALINTFFRVRKAAIVEVAFGVVLSGSAFLLINRLNHPRINTKDDYGGLIVALYAVTVVPGGAVAIGEGTITYIIYTRKKLLHILANYQQGNALPKRFKNRRRFKQELRIVKGIKPTFRNFLMGT